MKSVLIIYAAAIEEDIFELIKKLEIKKYTKFPYMHGIGGHSEPHLDTQVWPGSNIAVMIVINENIKNKLIAQLAVLKKKYLNEGLKAFVWEIEEEI